MSATDFRDSVGFTAGVAHERRRIGELLRQRITTLQVLLDFDRSPSDRVQRNIRAVMSELRRLAEVIEQEPD